ncbi:MAG: hypothetical protein ACI35V_12580, partial [Sphingobacterium composti]
MLKKTKLMTAVMLFSTSVAFSQMKVRDELPDKYKWNLTDLYATDDAWKAEKDRIQQEMQKAAQYKGKLTQSASTLLEALEFSTKISKEMTRLYSYASMMSDQDTRVTKYAGMKQEMSQLFSQYGALTSYMEPELLTLTDTQLKSFFEKEKGLSTFKFYLTDLLRKRAHTGSEEVEKILAYSSLMAGNAAEIYSTFSNAEFPYGDIEVDGKKVKLNAANFSLYRASENRDVRKKAFEVYFGKLNEFQRTLGSTLYGNLKSASFYAKARNYNSTLESALDAGNIPTDVYHNLVKNVNSNLETFHRY